MELDKDHIHFLLEFKPSLSIESVVNRLKSISTNYIYKKCYSYLKNSILMKIYSGQEDIFVLQLVKFHRKH